MKKPVWKECDCNIMRLMWKPLMVITFIKGKNDHSKQLITVNKLRSFCMMVPELEGKVTLPTPMCVCVNINTDQHIRFNTFLKWVKSFFRAVGASARSARSPPPPPLSLSYTHRHVHTHTHTHKTTDFVDLVSVGRARGDGRACWVGSIPLAVHSANNRDTERSNKLPC